LELHREPKEHRLKELLPKVEKHLLKVEKHLLKEEHKQHQKNHLLKVVEKPQLKAVENLNFNKLL
jgi:hypothetical protein